MADDPNKKQTTHGGWIPRDGSIYWYPMDMLHEIVVYPLAFGQARLVRGRRDNDEGVWEVGFDYPDRASALRAAGQWDGKGDPGYGYVRSYEEGEAEGA